MWQRALFAIQGIDSASVTVGVTAFTRGQGAPVAAATVERARDDERTAGIALAVGMGA